MAVLDLCRSRASWFLLLDIPVNFTSKLVRYQGNRLGVDGLTIFHWQEQQKP
jgi:hypothetical protein